MPDKGLIDLFSAKNAHPDYEKKLSSIIESLPLGMHSYQLDTEGNLIFIGGNPAADKILGIDHSKFIGKKILEVFPSLEGTGIPEKYVSIASSGLPWHSEQVDYNDDVVRGAFEVHAFNTSPGSMAAVFSDITERISAAHELRKSEKRFREVIANMQDVFYRADLDGKITMVSPSGAKLLGYEDVEEMIGLDIGATFYAQPEKRKDFLDELSRKGRVENFEVALKRKNGTIVLVSTSSHYIIAQDNSVVGVEGTLRDITEHRRMEKQLLHAQKMEAVGTLASGIAHDFNNILQGILSCSDYLSDRLPADEKLRETVSLIEAAALRGADLVRGLLSFSRQEGTLSSTVDFKIELLKAKALLDRLMPKMIKIEVALCGENVFVKGDPAQIEQIILNLATNARDAMPKGGLLTISLSTNILSKERTSPNGAAPGPYMALVVSDNGIGIGEDAKNHIFEPFFTTKDSSEGTGLGLYVVYSIAKNLGGWAECISSIGNGSTFTVWIPLLGENSIMQKEGSRDISIVSRTPKLDGIALIVDDDEIIRQIVSQMLELCGMNTFLAESGERAIDIFSARKDQIDIVILDLGMPGMGGQACLKELINLKPSVKVIVASGYGDQSSTSIALENGASAFLGKPYSFMALTEKISSLIGL